MKVKEITTTNNPIADDPILEPIETESTLRRSTRSTRGKKPYILTLKTSNEIIEPKTYNEAIKSSQCNEWVNAMKEEISILKKTRTWNLVIAPPDVNIVSCK